jgi:hypothetical protein
MMKLMQLINKALFAGASRQLKQHLSRRILFSNVIFITLAIVYLVFIFIDLPAYLKWPWNLNLDQLTVPVMILYCFIGLYLNKHGYSYLGRVLLVILWPLLMHIIPVIMLNTPSDYYLAFPLGVIFHAVLIQLVISFRSEKVTFYVLMLLNFFLIIYAREFLLYFDLEGEKIGAQGVVGSLYYTLVAILYWLLFNSITFYVTKVLDKLIDNNDMQQALLLENNRALVSLNNRIESTNKSLEKEVFKRTRELQQTNTALTTYAYYNAHQIRGPFCRIKGIIMLKKLDAIDDTDYFEKLDLSISQLEEAIDEMQLHLNEVDERNQAQV